MKVQQTKKMQGIKKLGICLECGKDNINDNEDIVRLMFGSTYHVTFCLCSKCLNRLIGNLERIQSIIKQEAERNTGK